MKISPLFLFLLLLPLVLPAQASGVLTVEPAEINKEVVVDNLDEDFADITAVVVTNNSRRTLQLVSATRPGRLPRGWNYSATDLQVRATPYVMSAAEQRNGRPVALGPGESATFYVVLKPDGMTGTGGAEVRFSDLSVPGPVLGTSKISTRIRQLESAAESGSDNPTAAGTAARPTPTTVRLYPNPAPERFFVEAPRGTTIGRVEVANTLGRRLRTFDAPPTEEGYDIEKLPDGLYLISVFDDKGKKLKTLRLLHRRFGGA